MLNSGGKELNIWCCAFKLMSDQSENFPYPLPVPVAICLERGKPRAKRADWIPVEAAES